MVDNYKSQEKMRGKGKPFAFSTGHRACVLPHPALAVTSSRGIALFCTAWALAVSGAAALFTIGFTDWEPSILVRMSQIEPMTEIAASTT